MIEENKEKEIVIGQFKPKRKFLNFISGTKTNVRFIRETAFIDGKQLSGTLEGLLFKITICDEGTIDFIEVDNKVDSDQIKRLIDDIDSSEVGGYTNRFVVSGLEFKGEDGLRCYLEVENQRPYDKLLSLFDEVDDPEVSTSLSDKGHSILDQLFADEDLSDNQLSDVEENIAEDFIDEINSEDTKVEVKTEEKESFMEEQFRKMNEDKIKELSDRIQDKKKEITKYDRDKSQAESNLTKAKSDLDILNTRYESMTPGKEPNGFVFFVSEAIKEESELDEKSTKLVEKISSIAKLNSKKLIEFLTKEKYNIRIAHKDDFTKEVDSEIYKNVVVIDSLSNFNINDDVLEYRGDLNWHQLVGKLVREGFELSPDFDKHCNSNSYDSSILNEKVEKDEKVEKEEVSDTKTLIANVPPVEEFAKFNKLKTYDKNTTLVVVGMEFNNNSDFGINDDYSSISVRVDGVKHSTDYGGYETNGFVSILTLDEFKQFKIDNDVDVNDGIESFLVTNLIGDIEVGVELDGAYNNKFNFDDYILHQIDSDDVSDVFINFPKGTNIIEMENMMLPNMILRDIKLDEVLRDKDEE